jgi:signal transduction histidine kinase
VDWFAKLRLFVANEVVDLGIPPDALRPEDMRRVRIISITTLCMCVAAGIPALVQFATLELHTMLAGTIATMAAAIANLFLLRARRRPRLSAHLAVAVFGSLLIMSNVTSGGFYHPNFAWLYVIPLGAAALIDLRGAAFWTVATITVSVVFWLLPGFGIDLPNRIPEDMREANSLYNRVTAIFAIGVVASSFVAGQRRAERQLAVAHDEVLSETAYVQLLTHAAVAANEALSFENAMRDSMERICETMGWTAGHIYLVDEDGSSSSSGIGHTRDPSLEGLQDWAQTSTWQKGAGIVGRAVAERCPIVVDVEVAASEEAADATQEAQRAGVRSAMTIPIFVNGDIAAVMLFASPQPLDNTERLIGVFSLIGTQLGRVAERTALQERVQQSQKMEAVGQLAAGVAHEINNPMSYVRANLHALREEWEGIEKQGANAAADRFDDCRELIEESLEGVERTIAIVRDVKEFSHTGIADRARWETVAVAELLDGALRVATPQAPPGINIETSHQGDAACFCSPNQIRQVFVNLIVNAIQAVGERGRIQLSTGREGNEIFARVEDDGPGMNEATLERLFDPFFTTKPVGEGTGLGLSVSYEIVRNHGGDLNVSSEPGSGACFEVRLPVEG